MDVSPQTMITVAVSITCSIIGHIINKSKSRPVSEAWFACLLLGPIGLTMILLAPRKDGGASNQGLILLGIPLGYVASYLFQPGIVRMFLGMGDYVLNAHRVLVNSNLSDGSAGSEFGRGMAVTAWICMGVGFLGMGLVVNLLSKPKELSKPDTTNAV